MPPFCKLFLTIVSLAALGSGCNDYTRIEVANLLGERYKHDLYSSQAECRRLNSTYEISCSETVEFGSDGQANILLGGGDIILRSAYTQKGNIVTINPTAGLPKAIVFVIVSKTELVRQDDKSKWQRY